MRYRITAIFKGKGHTLESVAFVYFNLPLDRAIQRAMIQCAMMDIASDEYDLTHSVDLDR